MKEDTKILTIDLWLPPVHAHTDAHTHAHTDAHTHVHTDAAKHKCNKDKARHGDASL